MTALAVSDRRAPSSLLFLLAVGTGAFLVFWIQPLVVKRLVPALGGSPAVWTTSLVFFQGALLAGYGLAHLLDRTLGSPSRHLLALAAVWILAFLSLPPGASLPLGEEPPAGMPPVLWLLATLALEVGPVFVATSLVTPIVSSWLARSAHPGRDDPYFLYSASNLGSLGALLAYPFVLEPLVSGEAQRVAYSVVFVGLFGLLAVLVRAAAPRDSSEVGRAAARALPGAGRVLALAGIPSALLVAVTVHISTDVASAPLLWVAPLVVYLATFAIAFARKPPVSHRIAGIAAIIGFADLVLLVGLGPFDAWAVLGHLLGLFVIALYCHGELARRRPAPAALTLFYLLVSTGGVLGGLGAAILAPLFFDSVMEYPIVLAGFALLLPYGRKTASPRARLFGVLPVWTLRPVLAVLLLVLFFQAGTVSSAALVAQERSFFGVYRVVDYDEPARRLLYHGTTVHGAERVLADGSRESRTTYYTPEGPLAEVMTAHAGLVAGARVGLVGLGTGSLACFARPGDEYRFYEIDPLVAALAREHFAALESCEPRGGIVLGDARLALAAEPAGRFDLLVLDAFSSDAIPIHLLTEEAFGVYLRALADEGLVVAHVSNRHLVLAPVLARLAAELGLAGASRFRPVPVEERSRTLDYPSQAVVLARSPERLAALNLSGGWKPLLPPHDSPPAREGGGAEDSAAPAEGPLWRDDFSSLLTVIRWW